MPDLKPRGTVNELDKHIVGQAKAKRAVAIALRNRWRRKQLSRELRDEVTPKNILMIGPTGVGKTEIARRVAKLTDAPFIKVEATKFTEVGYVGRDVDSIVRSLAEEATEERILDALLPLPRAPFSGDGAEPAIIDPSTREVFRQKLRDGMLDDKEIEIEITSVGIGVEIMAPPGMEEMTNQLRSMFQNLASDRRKTRKLKVTEARKILREEESAKVIDNEDIKTRGCKNAEENGIIFIDEIDKIAKRSEHSGADVSREGVQRDLLPLIEGTTVSTKYGPVRTDHILFIASGAFHVAKPSDLMPELQGRLPIRVELDPLTPDDFERILTEPRASLTEQYVELLKTEGVSIKFTKDGVKRMAEVAWHVNERTENIGARRLHTVIERVLESISFEAEDFAGQDVVIDTAYVNKHLEHLIADEDLSRYIL